VIAISELVSSKIILFSLILLLPIAAFFPVLTTKVYASLLLWNIQYFGRTINIDNGFGCSVECDAELMVKQFDVHNFVRA